jgi:ribosome maturation factor RimP
MGWQAAEGVTEKLARQEDLQAIVDPAVRALGFELWGLEHLSQGRHSLLRIYIDSEQGVTVDDCAAVSRQVGAVLDVEEPIVGEYTLEVSSPGINRSLFHLDQYRRYLGEPLKLRLRAPFDGRRKFSGTLTGVEGEDVVLRIDEDEYLLPFGSIEKAVVEPVLETSNG